MTFADHPPANVVIFCPIFECFSQLRSGGSFRQQFPKFRATCAWKNICQPKLKPKQHISVYVPCFFWNFVNVARRRLNQRHDEAAGPRGNDVIVHRDLPKDWKKWLDAHGGGVQRRGFWLAVGLDLAGT